MPDLRHCRHLPLQGQDRAGRRAGGDAIKRDLRFGGHDRCDADRSESAIERDRFPRASGEPFRSRGAASRWRRSRRWSARARPSLSNCFAPFREKVFNASDSAGGLIWRIGDETAIDGRR
jgi:hypothetical protein